MPDPDEVFMAAKITKVDGELVTCTTAKGEDVGALRLSITIKH